MTDDEELSPELVLIASQEEAEEARRSLPLPWSEASASDEPPAESDTPRPASTKRRRTRSVAAALALVLAAGAALGVVLTRNSSSGPEASTDTTTRTRTAVTRALTPPTRSAPASTTGFVPARTFAWVKASGVEAYSIRLFRNGRLVLRGRTIEPRYTVPRTFTFSPGSYRWQVVAVGGGELGRVLVDSGFIVS